MLTLQSLLLEKKKIIILLSSELVDSSVFACKNDNKIRIGSTQKKIIKERSQVLKFTIFEVVNVECGLVTSSEVASVKSNIFFFMRFNFKTYVGIINKI